MSSSAERGPVHRLFFALWPNDALRQQISDLVEPFLEGRKARRVRVPNLHITLAFLGSVAQHDLPKVIEAADRVSGAAFDLTLDHLETWRRAHVACITVDPLPPALVSCVEQLKSNLSAMEVEVDHKEFRAHVTVARDWRDTRLDERIGPVIWSVRDFALVESKQGHHGPDYHVMKQWSLDVAAARE